jgi:hypothetical protein
LLTHQKIRMAATMKTVSSPRWVTAENTASQNGVRTLSSAYNRFISVPPFGDYCTVLFLPAQEGAFRHILRQRRERAMRRGNCGAVIGVCALGLGLGILIAAIFPVGALMFLVAFLLIACGIICLKDGR